MLDPSHAPKKKFVLALDEIVIAFRKMVDKLVAMIAAAEKDLKDAGSAAGEEGASSAALAVRVEKGKQALEDARRLQRNVPLAWHYATTDAEVAQLSASLQEDVETFQELCGIVGWNRIAFILNKPDELQKAGEPHAAADVAEAL